MRVHFAATEMSVVLIQTTRLGAFWQNMNLYSRHWRLYCHDAGGAGVVGPDLDLAFEANHVYLLPPHSQLRARIGPSRFDRVWQFHIHFTLAHGETALPHAVHWFKPQGSLLKRIWRIARMGPVMDPRAEHEREILSLGVLLQSISEVLEGGTQQDIPDSCDERIAEAVRLMTQQLSSPLPIDVIAEHCQLSKSGLIRLFKREVGMPPWQYFNHLRMDQASVLLQTTSLSIEDIAEQLGYPDRFQFSRSFKRIMHQSPVAWRKTAASFTTA